MFDVQHKSMMLEYVQTIDLNNIINNNNKMGAFAVVRACISFLQTDSFEWTWKSKRLEKSSFRSNGMQTIKKIKKKRKKNI